MNLFGVSWEDVYEYLRCPKVLSYKAYQALNQSHQPLWQRSNGEVGFEPKQPTISQTTGTQEIRSLSKEVFDNYLKCLVHESLGESGQIIKILEEEYGKIEVLGKAEARHPDLACVARPHYFAFTSDRTHPILVEVKNSEMSKREDEFKAKFYNGLSDASGVFLIKQRLEDGAPKLNSYVSEEQSETVLIYPHSHEIVREKFVVDTELAKKVALAKQLGYREMSPETDCGPGCVNRRCKVRFRLKLKTGKEELLRPLPLMIGEGLLKRSFDFDTYHDAYYGWEIMNKGSKFCRTGDDGWNLEWRRWLINGLCLRDKAVGFLIGGGTSFNPWRIDAETLLKDLGNDGEAWRRVLGYRLDSAASSLLGKIKSVYALPKGSDEFLSDAMRRWQ